VLARLDDSFEKAVDSCLPAKGRVVVNRNGKSGLIGRKISETLSSKNSVIFFAMRGGSARSMGMLARGDALLAVSYGRPKPKRSFASWSS